MAHPRETRLALRGAYLVGLPIEQAATKADVPLATARRWKAEALAAGDDWDKFQRASLIVAGGGMDQSMGRVVAGVILRCEALMERIAADAEIDPVEATRAVASLTDSLAKAHAAAKRLMPETDRYAVAMDVLKRLAEHSMARKPGAFTAELVELLEAFGAELGKTYG
jgi:thioredoxin-like negative regulator of GroEL